MEHNINKIDVSPICYKHDAAAISREQAVSMLMEELKKGEDSAMSQDDWISEETVLKKFGVEL